jgi:hypothetical protein
MIGTRQRVELTLDIVLGVRVRSLVVMHHLHNLEQVILVEFLETISQFVHIHLAETNQYISTGAIKRKSPAYVLLGPLLLLCTLITATSPLLQPVFIAGDGASFAESSQEGRLGVLEHLQSHTCQRTA